MNSSSSKERMRTACGCCPVFFSIKVDMCLRYLLLSRHSLSTFPPPSTSICFMRQVKLKIAHLKIGWERESAGKVQPRTGVANFQLWQLAPNRIMLFPQFSCATAEEEGSVKISFRQLRRFWLLEIACDINRFDDALLLVLIEKFLGTKIEKYSREREFTKRGSKDNKYNTELIKSNNNTVQILKLN